MEGSGGQRIFCHQCDVSDLGRVQEVFRLIMLEAGTSSIVNIASVGGLNPVRARTSYNNSKFGLIGLTESMEAICSKAEGLNLIPG